MSADRCPAEGRRIDMGLLPCEDTCESCPYKPVAGNPSSIISTSPFVQLNLNRHYPLAHVWGEDEKKKTAKLAAEEASSERQVT